MFNQFNPLVYTHGGKLERKSKKDKTASKVFEEFGVMEAYNCWKEASLCIQQRDKDSVLKLVAALNTYKDAVEPIFDSRLNSAQEVLQPSILEEFFEYLFSRIDSIVGVNIPIRHPAKGYLSLSFNPHNIETLIQSPEYTVRAKDHDFIIGGSAKLTIQGHGGEGETTNIVVPAVAIGCKRYLERNMLDECAGTAERLKRATPYCLYFVVAEYLKLDDGAPELTEIDEIYILRHQRNSERNKPGFKPNPIDGELIWDLYQEVMNHLGKIWWDPNSALQRGKVFNRP
nr:mutant BbvCI restriction endonuclease subunit 2 [synthetic construct]